MSNIIQKLIRQSENPTVLLEALEFAGQIHKEKIRSFGESYIDHAVDVAFILQQMNLDQTTIVAGLLHDVADTHNPDNKKSVINEVAKKFGSEVARIVEKNSELNKIYYVTRAGLKGANLSSKANIENLRKMFFAISGDLRVVLIDLASRIDGMAKINQLPLGMQKAYATETLEIFVPVANRLGLGEIKTKLEDLAFAHLEPEKCIWLKENIKEQYDQRQRYLKKFIPHLQKIFAKERLPYLDINYRAKSYWSTYQKLLTHNMDFEKIHDLVALRIIVKDVADCYKALGILHKYYRPTSKEIKDYIARPKINGYQSLHTTVFLEENQVSEIQIRTAQMQQDAQFGVCAHWSYKEKINLQKETETLNFSSQVPEFWKTFTIDFFADQLFAFTPKGDIIVLPKGSTPVDFAYALHSDIGNHCESAKIDGKIITLTQVLKNGDVVEIITNKKRKPSQDWLRFVKTNFARANIKKIITAIPASLFSVPTFVKKQMTAIRQGAQKRKAEKIQNKKEKPSQIYLAGQKGIAFAIAKCCNPKTGDPTKAYLSRHKGAVLHKISCENLKKLSQKSPEKIIAATWKQA